MFGVSILPLGWTWHGSLCKSSPLKDQEWQQFTAAILTGGWGGSPRGKPGGCFQKKIVTAHIYWDSPLPGVVLSTVHVLVHSSCPLTTGGGAILIFFHSHLLGELPPLPRNIGLVSVEPGSNPGSLFPEMCF